MNSIFKNAIVMPPRGGSIKGRLVKFHRGAMKFIPVMEKKWGGSIFYKRHPFHNENITTTKITYREPIKDVDKRIEKKIISIDDDTKKKRIEKKIRDLF